MDTKIYFPSKNKTWGMGYLIKNKQNKTNLYKTSAQNRYMYDSDLKLNGYASCSCTCIEIFSSLLIFVMYSVFFYFPKYESALFNEKGDI